MKKVYFAIGHQLVENFITKQMEGKIEVVGTTVYRENILPAVLEKQPDVLITRETLPGSTEFLEIIDRIRVECDKDIQIIFITGGRQPGDAFLSALIRYQVFDLVIGDNIDIKEVCRMIEQPNKYRDVFMYAPKVKVDEKTKKEIFKAPSAPKVIEKEIIKEIIIDKTTLDDIHSSKGSLEELQKIEEQKKQIEEEQAKLLQMKSSLENEKLAIEESKIKMNEDYERRKAEFEEEVIVRLRSIENDRDNLIKIEQEKLHNQIQKEMQEIERLKAEAEKAINADLKEFHQLKQQEVENKMKTLEEENERKIKELKDEAFKKSIEEQEKFNQIRLEEIEKFQEDKRKLERKYQSLREEQDRQAKLREEQEAQMKYQMELLKEEQKKLKEQKEHDLLAIEEAKKQLEEERERLIKEAEEKIKQEKDNINLILKEKEEQFNIEKNQLINDYSSLNSNVTNRLKEEKLKIEREANLKFNKYKEELKSSMIKKLEEEKSKLLSANLNESQIEEKLKELQYRLNQEYAKKVEEKLNAIKIETSEKFKLVQDKMKEFKEEEESRLQLKQFELEKEKEEFEKHKEKELKSLEDEKREYENKYKELEEKINQELIDKEKQLAQDRKLMEEKQIQLKAEMNDFLKKEKQKLKALNEEELSKERENLRILEEERQKEIELEKEKLIQEKRKLERTSEEQKRSMEKEKKEFDKKVQLIKEEEERIAERERLVREQEKNVQKISKVSGDMRAIAFVGCKSGLGNSTIALNTAISLANNNNRVLYLEINDKFTTTGYSYKLSFYNSGIDLALEQLQSNHYEKISKNIISLNDVISNTEKEDIMLQNYKKMPKNLDYMFYSGKYFIEDRGNIKGNFKELIIHLLTMYDYDYIIFDLNIKEILYKEDSYLFDEISQTILQFSSKTYFTITQDISAVGSYMQYQKMLKKSNVSINNLKLILNKYEQKVLLDKKGLEEWTKMEIDLIIPNKIKDAINSTYTGLPLILYSKDKELQKAFTDITYDILDLKNKNKNKKLKKGAIKW